MPDFLPRRDADLRVWSDAFSRQLNDSPEAYGVSAQQAADFAALQQAYTHRYAASQSPKTRTAVNIQAKDSARDTMIASARELAGVVRSRRATTDAQLVTLGLRPRKLRSGEAGEDGKAQRRGRGRRHVPRPRVAPLVHVRRVQGRRMWLRVSASVAFSQHSKPADASMLTVLYAVGDRPPESVEGFSFWKVTGKTRLVFDAPPSMQPGGQVWLIASWMNDRGEQGPWCAPVPGRVGYGVVPVAGQMRRAA